MSASAGSRPIRVLRAAVVAVLALNAALAVALAAVARVPVVNMAMVALLAMVMFVQTIVIKRIDPEGRSRLRPAETVLRKITGRRKPDYARIRELERECGIGDYARTGTKTTGLGITMAQFGEGLERLMTNFDYASATMRAYGKTWHNGELVWDSTTTEEGRNGTQD